MAELTPDDHQFLEALEYLGHAYAQVPRLPLKTYNERSGAVWKRIVLLIRNAPHPNAKMGEMIAWRGSLSRADLAKALRQASPTTDGIDFYEELGENTGSGVFHHIRSAASELQRLGMADEAELLLRRGRRLALKAFDLTVPIEYPEGAPVPGRNPEWVDPQPLPDEIVDERRKAWPAARKKRRERIRTIE